MKYLKFAVSKHDSKKIYLPMDRISTKEYKDLPIEDITNNKVTNVPTIIVVHLLIMRRQLQKYL